ncbi:hypothetical protein DID77_00995, partial [Candidatus Marinamargulisbacteria bacterium SCGC AG-439-L15]
TPIGWLYTDVHETITLGPSPTYSKVISGSTMGLFGMLGFGDVSLKKLLGKSGIKEVHRIDKRTVVVGFIYKEEIYTVYGI